MYLGDIKLGTTITIEFNTYNQSGASVAPLSAFEASDIQIYKDTIASGTKKATTNGLTMNSPANSLVGLHSLDIDTGNNTGDTGFWAAGHDYFFILSPDTETVDSQTVIASLRRFSIENRCVNWAQVVSPTTTLNLSGTTVKTLTDAPADSSGVTTLLSRLTSARAGYLDVLNGIVAAIWAAVTDSSGVTTLLSRLTSGRASALDNLDATVSSRLASASYTAPDNSTISTINTKVGTPASSVSADIAAVKTDTGNLVTRITSTLFSGITSLAQWLGLLAGKQTGNNTARTEIRATGAGSGTFDETSDSLEAQKDNPSNDVRVIETGTLQGVGDPDQPILGVGASTTNDFYNGYLLIITGGAGVGQCRTIYDYTGLTKQAQTNTAFLETIDGTSTYAIIAHNNPFVQIDAGSFTISRLDSTGRIQMKNDIFGYTVETVTIQGDPVTISFADAIRGIMAGTFNGLASGMEAGSLEATIQNADGTKTRIVMTIDGEGNRTEVVSMDLS